MRRLESLLAPLFHEHNKVLCYCLSVIDKRAVGEALALPSIYLKEVGANTGEKGPLCCFSPPSLNILDAFLEESTYCSDPADLTLEFRGIAGPTEWTLFHWFSTVDGPVRCSTDVERVVHVIIKLVGICGVLLAGCQDFPGLREGRNILFKSSKSFIQLKLFHRYSLVVSLVQDEITLNSKYTFCQDIHEGVIITTPVESGFSLLNTKEIPWI